MEVIADKEAPAAAIPAVGDVAKQTPVTSSPPNQPIAAAAKNCKEIAQVPPGSANEMGAKLQEMILHYYEDVRKQAQQSFYCALGAAAVGSGFFGYAAWLTMQAGASANISLIAGSVIEVISAINFVLYGRAARQFSSFHICLERTNRFILANTLCDNISCSVKRDTTRQELIQKIADAPMLTLQTISEGS